VSGQLHSPAALPPGKSPRYPLYKRLGGPQSRSGRNGEVKILDSTGTRTTTSQSSSTQPVVIATALSRLLQLSQVPFKILMHLLWELGYLGQYSDYSADVPLDPDHNHPNVILIFSCFLSLFPNGGRSSHGLGHSYTNSASRYFFCFGGGLPLHNVQFLIFSNAVDISVALLASQPPAPWSSYRSRWLSSRF
jgi:hypothetical protein